MTKEIHKRLEHSEDMPPVLVLGNPQWRPALVGLAANKLAEEYRRPVFLWGKDGNGMFKGSCRSGGEVSVVTLMSAIPDVFLEYGGHHASGGFSVKDENIFSLGEELNKAYESLGEQAIVSAEEHIDEVLLLDGVTHALVEDIALLAPYGTGNRKPLFAFKDVTPRKVEQFGKAGEHLKVMLETSGGVLEGIAFFTDGTSFKKNPHAESVITLIAHVERSYFMGRRQVRLRIIDAL
jgi:single-stranded-DNA-specific exonuclease